jgi:hypothetical protein
VTTNAAAKVSEQTLLTADLVHSDTAFSTCAPIHSILINIIGASLNIPTLQATHCKLHTPSSTICTSSLANLATNTSNSILASQFSLLFTESSNMENFSDNMTAQKRGFVHYTASFNKRQRLGDFDITADHEQHFETRNETVDDTASGAAESDDNVGQAETAGVKDEVR